MGQRDIVTTARPRVASVGPGELQGTTKYLKRPTLTSVSQGRDVCGAATWHQDGDGVLILIVCCILYGVYNYRWPVNCGVASAIETNTSSVALYYNMYRPVMTH